MKYVTRFFCYRTVVRLKPIKPAYMKASSKWVSFPKIISGCIGDAVQPGSEWRR